MLTPDEKAEVLQRIALQEKAKNPNAIADTPIFKSIVKYILNGGYEDGESFKNIMMAAEQGVAELQKFLGRYPSSENKKLAKDWETLGDMAYDLGMRAVDMMGERKDEAVLSEVAASYEVVLTVKGAKDLEEKVVYKGKLFDVTRWCMVEAKKRGMTFKEDSSIFGGYYVDSKSGETLHVR